MFKPGDKIRRLVDDHGIAEVGKIYTFREYKSGYSERALLLIESPDTYIYISEKFELVTKKKRFFK